MWFSTEAHLPILRTLLDLWHRNESKSGLGSWFRVLVDTAHKTRQTLTINFTDYIKKRDFLYMTSNIDKLYTVGKHFLSRVWIWNRHLKIRLRLAWIYLQNFSFLHKNTCRQSGHFLQEQRIPFDKEVQINLLGPKNGSENGQRAAE